MPGPWPTREAQRVATRERLVACATDVVRAHGLSELTVDRVASAAAVNRTTFYLHFTGRNELSLAVGLQYLVEVGRLLAVWDEVRRPSRAAARRWVDATVAALARDAALLEVLEHGLLTMPEAAPVLREAMDAAVACMPRTVARVGERRRPQLHAAAWQVVRTAGLLSAQKGLLDRDAALDLLARQWLEETAPHPL
jgi:AcrR family transcriptional regulator